MHHRSWRLGLWVVISICLHPAIQAQNPLPKVLDSRLKLELFAENPQLATPTGIDIDHLGRVWALESNTHFPPEGYQGHKTDRLLVLRDANGDGRADEVTLFSDDLIHAMSVAVRPLWYPVPARKTDKRILPAPKLSVYVATRKEILLLHDDDGDLRADRRERLVHLDTPGDYPHDGLAGIAFDATGWMYFGFGENLGADYKAIGVDGTTLSGGGEGGSIFRCRLDGTQLTRWTTGFWNPHASCIDAYGQLFSVDNDADSRPPCRLLHMIPGGDYGYRYRNGRKGLHPFTAWNGEIPGTLPMVAGTGEAPSGIVAYESEGFPEEYLGNLLVGSWGDHRIDRFRLKQKGASFESLAEPLVVGNENFRPVGLAVAPDGSLYFTDWVLRDYKLHGRGRIWRLSPVAPREKPVPELAAMLNRSTQELYPALSSTTLAVRREAAHLLAQSHPGRNLLSLQVPDTNKSPTSRMEALWALVNVACQTQPPEDLLPMLRSLAVNLLDRPRTGSGTGFAVAGGRFPRGVERAELWLEDQKLQDQFPSFNEVLSLVRPTGVPVSSQATEPEPTRLAKAHAYLRKNTGKFETKARIEGFLGQFKSADPFLQSMAIQCCSKLPDEQTFRELWETWQTVPANATKNVVRQSGRDGRVEMVTVPLSQDETVLFARVALVLGARSRFPKQAEFVSLVLKDKLPAVRRLGVQWAAEERLKDLRPEVEALLRDDAIDSDLFLTTLAALEMLDGVSPVDFDKTPASKYVLPLVIKDGPVGVRKLALRLVSPSDPALTVELYQQFLASPDESLRLEAIRTLQLSPLPAAAELLQGVAGNPEQPLVARAEAIAGLAVAAKSAPADSPLRGLLDKIIKEDTGRLRVEALRTLRGSAVKDKPSPAVVKLAAKLIADKGPAAAPFNESFLELALYRDASRRAQLPRFAEAELVEQLRLALTGAPATEVPELPAVARPKTVRDWDQLATVFSDFALNQPAVQSGGAVAQLPSVLSDPPAGRRVFFHINSAGCAKCHTIDGRGGKIGPDLTTIARTMDREKLTYSILEPSREMAPQFVSWTFELKTGKVLTGLILSEESEKLKIGTPDGQVHDLTLNEIESRTPQKTSLMPEKLIDQLTMQEFLDLLAFLETLK